MELELELQQAAAIGKNICIQNTNAAFFFQNFGPTLNWKTGAKNNKFLSIKLQIETIFTTFYRHFNFIFL